MNNTFCHLLFPFLFVTTTAADGYAPKQPLVETKYGQVRGLIQLSRNGREYTSYRGIPYAKPPIENLRFKAPEPPTNWSFPIDATKEGPFCIQKNYLFANPTVEGKEDCLYLNIYVPNVTKKELLPVMVFIHWGGFFAGRGTSDYIGPEYLMDRDVILVTFNYRLAVLGFLTTLDDIAPGNYAMKDQVLALKFVRDNIGYFGGDKNRVTIFGQSAGSGSVSLHLVSPASTGLFQQAISQSGASLDLWAKPLNFVQSDVTAAQATFVGCAGSIGNSTKLIACLRKVDAATLVESGDKFKTFSIEPLIPFSLVTETKTEANPEPFLTKDPLEYLQAGEFQKVPWILGNTQDEGILRAAPLLRQKNTLDTLNANFSTLIPQMLFLQLSAGANTSTLYENIVDYYLGGKHFIDVNDRNSVQGFTDLYSDRAFVYGIYQNVILQSLKHHTPIWLYNFNYKGKYTYGDLFAATNSTINFDWGVSHCDDLLYLFRSPALFPSLTAENDLRMTEDLLNLWTNFATYGDPDPKKSINWNSLKFAKDDDIKNENLVFLNITGHHSDNEIDFKIDKGYFTDRVKFWLKQPLAENFAGLA